MKDANLQETVIKRLNTLETIAKRLNTLISLMLEIASPDETASITKKVERLISFGLSPAEVGEILGKPTNYISAVMHKKKNKTKKRN